MAKKAQYDPNKPYAGLIDLDKLVQWDQDKEQRLKRVARNNALADSFRLLGEAVYGSKGAPISARGTNPVILQSLSEYTRMDEDYKNRLDRWRLMDLQTNAKNIDYQIGEKRRGEDQDMQREGWERQDTRAQEALAAADTRATKGHEYNMAEIKERGGQQRQTYDQLYGSKNSFTVRDPQKGDMQIPISQVDKYLGILDQALTSKGVSRFTENLMIEQPMLYEYLSNPQGFSVVDKTQLIARAWPIISEFVYGKQGGKESMSNEAEQQYIADMNEILLSQRWDIKKKKRKLADLFHLLQRIMMAMLVTNQHPTSEHTKNNTFLGYF